MVDYWPSAGPVWYWEPDVQVALLLNQVNAVQFQLAQSNQQLWLQQNLIFSLQQQIYHHEPECSKCCKAKMSAAVEPCAESTEESQKSSNTAPGSSEEDTDWTVVEAPEDAATEDAPPIAAGSPMVDPVVPSPAALWLGPVCHQCSDRSCEVVCMASDSESEIGDEDIRWDESPAGRQLCCHSLTALTGIEVSAGECTPSDLHVANLLPYLGVQELLNLRLVSRRTRSPEALTAHVAEMGSMETADAVHDFAGKLELYIVNPNLSDDSAFEGDDEQQKLFLCRSWCMALASKDFTHFAESYVRRTVGKNLQCLLRHCWSADASVAAAAHLALHNHASDALPFVQQAIAEGIFALLEDLASNSTQIESCLRTLEKLVRSLSKHQRQRWVSLMVKLLVDPNVATKERLVLLLKMLWLADEDPKRTYAEEDQQLRSVAVSDTGAFKNDILSLLNSS
ncbi:PAO3 [Symbiodinium sp. CCMP2592]|nr:PAO3 [Symbiodinium sp. CCMP2592]